MAERFVLNETSYFGRGSRQELANEIKSRGYQKVFLVTDNVLVECGVVAKVTEVLDKAKIKYKVFSDVKPNPTVKNVQAGVKSCKLSKADVIVAVGGGSAIDTAKGIAIIMTVIDELLHNNIEYPNIIVTFTPDEEIGRGTDAFNYEYYKEKNCSIAYTLDGGEPHIVNYENFNAASCVVEITGKSIHPGSAKNKMINASLVAIEFNELLPKYMVPSMTEGYEGFNHLVEISSSVSSAKLVYIIRNHDMNLFKEQKVLFEKACEYLNIKYIDL